MSVSQDSRKTGKPPLPVFVQRDVIGAQSPPPTAFKAAKPSYPVGVLAYWLLTLEDQIESRRNASDDFKHLVEVRFRRRADACYRFSPAFDACNGGFIPLLDGGRCRLPVLWAMLVCDSFQELDEKIHSPSLLRDRAIGHEDDVGRVDGVDLGDGLALVASEPEDGAPGLEP